MLPGFQFSHWCGNARIGVASVDHERANRGGPFRDRLWVALPSLDQVIEFGIQGLVDEPALQVM